MNMDRMIGGQYEKGLATLESLATAVAGKQAAAVASAPKQR
jgi:hypothetical protein